MTAETQKGTAVEKPCPPVQPTWEIREGDALAQLREMSDESVHCCITSPPYYGLRDYGAHGQIGLEDSPERYVERLVEVFREVRRVLRDDGTLWVNLGDSYAGSRGGPQGESGEMAGRSVTLNRIGRERGVTRLGAKPKDLLGIPWMVAFALRADGWYLRSDVIWAKPNPMPESVTDRPTSAHEHLFLLAKSRSYYYDADAIREPDKGTDHTRTVLHRPEPSGGIMPPHKGLRQTSGRAGLGRNKRNVWEVSTQPFSGAHFATFPPKLIEPMVLAGCPEEGTVLDPFSGAGTTGMVALRHNRSYVGIELNPDYVELSRERIRDDAPLLNRCSERWPK